jgi:hypothetical protein
MGQDGVVTVSTGWLDDQPSCPLHGSHTQLVIFSGQDEIDVPHGPEARFGVAGGQCRSLEHHRLQSSIEQGTDCCRDRIGEDEERLVATQCRLGRRLGCPRPGAILAPGKS